MQAYQFHEMLPFQQANKPTLPPPSLVLFPFSYQHIIIIITCYSSLSFIHPFFSAQHSSKKETRFSVAPLHTHTRFHCVKRRCTFLLKPAEEEQGERE